MFELEIRLLLTILVPVLIANISSQVFKTILKRVLTGKLNLKVLISDCDFPSSHTTTIVTANIVVWYVGFKQIAKTTDESVATAILLTCIVLLLWTFFEIRDAMGIRLRVQENACHLQKVARSSGEFTKLFADDKGLSLALQKTYEDIGEKINIKAGHLPHEVLGGICLGSIVGFASVFKNENTTSFILTLGIGTVYLIFTVLVFLYSKKKNESEEKILRQEIQREKYEEQNNILE